MLLQYLYSLSICCITFFLFSCPLHGQEDNASLYRQLLSEYFEKNPGPYRSITGRFFKDYLPKINIDSTQSTQIQIQGYSILYNPLPNKEYLRSIEIPLYVNGEEEKLSYQDTLSAKVLRKIIKASPEPFKGEDPTFFSRWIQPAALIGVSVLGIIALFFVRSG
ncbi:MAG: hypothetical protein AAF696_04345 [Bacteroidota bacterium]